MNPMQTLMEMRGRPPEEAKFFWSGGPVEVAPNAWFASLFSGVTAFETAEGLVLVDSGLKLLAPQIAAMIREKTAAPVHTAIFTQGHVDHAFGLAAFLAPGQANPQVVAHKDMPARFARYAATDGHNQAINARQFGGAADAASGEAYQTFQAPQIEPNRLYDDRIDLTVGGVRFEVHHDRGETDDHTWVFAPDLGVLCPGDLFIWSTPNAGNPQKVQRYAKDWANALRKMAALKPQSLAPGHGGPVVNDPVLIGRMLSETAAWLEALEDRTVAAMNRGSPPHVDIVHEVEIPVSESPWLQPVYDEGEFVVRNIIRLYGGWWSGRPSELKPARREALAATIAELAGGAEALLRRAEAARTAGDLRLACHLADFALEAAPNEQAVQAAVAALYRRRAEGETSLMAINIFNSAAAYAEAGRAFR